jgi:formate hydrogenlyase subunit 3/multisubunit Na+/H+ antiporter MnhD subunit
MTLGNVGAMLQRSVKRLLAYSSIAHSGYMMIGLIAGPGLGINAVLFYLLAYGLMNSAAFAVLAGLERRGLEIESMDDLAGLRHRHRLMAIVMAVAAGSLLGVPPLLGFIGKVYLFVAGVEAGQVALVVIALLNSAVSAWYYLQLVRLPILYKPTAQSETIVRGPAFWPRLSGAIMAAALVVLPFFAGALIDASAAATAGYAAPAPPAPQAAAARSAFLFLGGLGPAARLLEDEASDRRQHDDDGQQQVIRGEAVADRRLPGLDLEHEREDAEDEHRGSAHAGEEHGDQAEEQQRGHGQGDEAHGGPGPVQVGR